MLNVRRLEVLKAVVDAGSVTGAAAAVGYTPSAVSQSLAALEREVKTPLFERVGRGIRPTQAGLLLAKHAEGLMAGLERAETELEALRSGQAGRLRLATFPTAGATLIPRALARFAAEFPGVELDLTMAEPEDALGALRLGHVDVAVIADHDRVDERGRKVDLTFTHLLDDPYRVVVPRTHSAATKRVVSLEELSDDTWISTASARCNCSETVMSACARAGFTPRFALEADEFATTVGFVDAGLGVAMVPMLALSSVPANVRVCRIRNAEPRRYVYSVTRTASTSDPLVGPIERALSAAAASYLRTI